MSSGMPIPLQLLRRQEVRAVSVARVVPAAALRGVGRGRRRRAPHADGAAGAGAGMPTQVN